MQAPLPAVHPVDATHRQQARVADLALVLLGALAWATEGRDATEGRGPAALALMVLAVVTVVPWTMGYLLSHFEGVAERPRRTVHWVFGGVTVALVGFLLAVVGPLLEEAGGRLAFVGAFAMFFTVLGPMMVLGGLLDAPALDRDEPAETSVTFVIGILALSVAFMIAIIGAFDPQWTGEAGGGVVALAFFGGPVAATLVAVPVLAAGQKLWTFRYVREGVRVGLPLVVFTTLAWWNDLVLLKLDAWAGGEAGPGAVLGALVLTGILPFRLVMLLRPPIRPAALLAGGGALACYVLGVLAGRGDG